MLVPNAMCEMCVIVTNHQVNVLFFSTTTNGKVVTLVKQSQELKTVSYHKLYDILKQHQNEVNEIRAERLARTPVVQKSGIQCYNCKEYGHVSRECQKLKRVKDATYHKEKMLLCKQEEAIQEVTQDPVDNSGPIFDDEPMHKVQNNNDNYNVFAMENDQDETDDLDQERDLLASLIQKLKCKIDDSKKPEINFLESSYKALVKNLKGKLKIQN
ncbi:retrovirus-related pol polyprotein from transposon TNT 1-94 [Tanacetum coccineum]|uniref:Retrovirus-related pol polyprotein from transposon TNT 1-94 n=1 Tax=Tanacetum coccineum TaxID=301880 RepID=A0ABQ5FQF3_9ASTR